MANTHIHIWIVELKKIKEVIITKFDGMLTSGKGTSRCLGFLVLKRVYNMAHSRYSMHFK